MILKLKAQTIVTKITALLALCFGVNWKVRASAIGVALLTSTIDYAVSGGAMTPALLVAVWGSALKAYFTKSVGVSNAPSPVLDAKTVPDKS